MRLAVVNDMHVVPCEFGCAAAVTNSDPVRTLTSLVEIDGWPMNLFRIFVAITIFSWRSAVLC